MQSVITLRDPSIVAARMDLAEMASIVLVTSNFLLKYFKVYVTCYMMTILVSLRKYYAQGGKKKN